MHLAKVDSDVEGLNRALGGLTIRDEPEAKGPFRFFDLPSELRIKIYELALVVPDRLVDLDPVNTRRIVPRIQCFRVSKQMHAEASGVFYGSQTFRLFPRGRFFHTKKTLVTRLPQAYRAAITSMELRLGEGWSSPPRCQKIDDALGLEDCTSLRTLKVFIEIDPSGDIFNGFRGRDNARDGYQLFCTKMLAEIFARTPSVVAVELDAYPSIGKDSPIVLALVDVIKKASKKVLWGPLRGWDREGDCGQLGLESALAGITL
ncbi:hypothetical protein K461DRAFT_268906 [Myriangium duriaei CBS 260.36]|uniref:Uncharacterized protein n=1 Tax=Myriangium duriaei CBS 260.36 TaxID=1168546 RepID=A0A9P4J1L7_9PEZI|nr:hypothetical protein K461DRAFT_268906 [Myriangium duriaei CBS 260.36]